MRWKGAIGSPNFPIDDEVADTPRFASNKKPGALAGLIILGGMEMRFATGISSALDRLVRWPGRRVHGMPV